MNHLVRPWRRRVALAVVLALALASAPVCLAGEPPGGPPSQPKLAASIDKAVKELGPTAKASESGAVARQSTTTDVHSSFFKSKTGMITVALLAAGTGFALYSTKHDRVRSPEVPYGGTWK